MNSIPTSNILFGFPSRPDIPIVFSILLGVLRHHIWLARNCYRFDHIPPDLLVALKNARSTFRFLVRMHKRHCCPDRFTREWLADGAVGSITDGGWIHFSRDFVTHNVLSSVSSVMLKNVCFRFLGVAFNGSYCRCYQTASHLFVR